MKMRIQVKIDDRNCFKSKRKDHLFQSYDFNKKKKNNLQAYYLLLDYFINYFLIKIFSSAEILNNVCKYVDDVLNQIIIDIEIDEIN